ncbi:MAG TPA: TolC family protein, partial [Balneolaceae bacterium]|nr:TolC family protein [Balneolaceae bacterium]
VRIKNGVGLSPEVLSSQADLQDMIARRASARNDYRKALVQIAHLTGQKTVNFDTRGQLPHLPEQKNLSVYSNVLYRRALTHRSDIDQLTYQSKQQKALAKSISAMKFPTLMLQSDFSYFGPEAFGYYSNLSSRGLKSYNWRVGIGINYPLFSGFKIRSQKKRNMALAQQYKEQKYELKNEIRTKIRTLLKDLETLQKLKKSNELFLKQVKANIRILKTSFKNGQIPRLTYIRAIIPKASAEAALVKTRSQIAETLVQLDAVVGTDISAILKNYSFKKTNEP